jgi:hypothetical protein
MIPYLIGGYLDEKSTTILWCIGSYKINLAFNSSLLPLFVGFGKNAYFCIM